MLHYTDAHMGTNYSNLPASSQQLMNIVYELIIRWYHNYTCIEYMAYWTCVPVDMNPNLASFSYMCVHLGDYDQLNL